MSSLVSTRAIVSVQGAKQRSLFEHLPGIRFFFCKSLPTWLGSTVTSMYGIFKQKLSQNLGTLPFNGLENFQLVQPRPQDQPMHNSN